MFGDEIDGKNINNIRFVEVTTLFEMTSIQTVSDSTDLQNPLPNTNKTKVMKIDNVLHIPPAT